MKLNVINSSSGQNNTIFATTGGRVLNPELPLIIFIHGAGMDHTVWNLHTRYFAFHGYSVLAFDFPGHGRSDGSFLDRIEQMADWIPELMNALELEKPYHTASLVGHSMGALAALECTSRYPERVRSLCLMGPSAKMPVHPDLLEAARKDDPLAYDLVTSWGHGPAGHLGRTPVPGLSLIGGGRALLSSAPKGALGNDLEACNVYQNGMNAAKNILCPTLCIIGSDDKMAPARKGMELASTIPESKTEIIHNCGHMMLLEDSNASLKALKGHLNSFES